MERGLTFQELIKLHGGTLEIESVTAAESKDGSRTSISIPSPWVLLIARWINLPM